MEVVGGKNRSFAEEDSEPRKERTGKEERPLIKMEVYRFLRTLHSILDLPQREWIACILSWNSPKTLKAFLTDWMPLSQMQGP